MRLASAVRTAHAERRPAERRTALRLHLVAREVVAFGPAPPTLPVGERRHVKRLDASDPQLDETEDMLSTVSVTTGNGGGAGFRRVRRAS